MCNVDIRNPYFDVIFCTLIYNENLFHFQNVWMNNMYKNMLTKMVQCFNWTADICYMFSTDPTLRYNSSTIKYIKAAKRILIPLA